jgi:hypothetical protein
LISRDIIASTSPCGANCTYTISFHGPLAKCNTTTLNESIPVEYNEGEILQYLPRYSGGWNSASMYKSSDLMSLQPGWVQPGESSSGDSCDSDPLNPTSCVILFNRPDTFFVSQHNIPQQELNVSDRAVTYQRSTQKTSCMLHRGKYTLGTGYFDGERTLNISTSREETLEALWAVDRKKPFGLDDRITTNITTSYQVMSIFALFDSLVQALRGEYYDTTSLRSYKGESNIFKSSLQSDFLCKTKDHSLPSPLTFYRGQSNHHRRLSLQ